MVHIGSVVECVPYACHVTMYVSMILGLNKQLLQDTEEEKFDIVERPTNS